MVAAIGKNRELGKDNKLLWHISDDLKHFKEVTSGHVVIMGRKTFESIGRPLPNRVNIVITRDKTFTCHSELDSESKKERSRNKFGPQTPRGEMTKCIVVHSLEEALNEAKRHVILSKSEGSPRALQSLQAFSPQEGYPLHGIAAAPQNDNNGEIMVIGGGQIFTQALPQADRLYLTIVDASFDADTFFPDYSNFTTTISKEDRESEGYRYSFLVLEK